MVWGTKIIGTPAQAAIAAAHNRYKIQSKYLFILYNMKSQNVLH